MEQHDRPIVVPEIPVGERLASQTTLDPALAPQLIHQKNKPGGKIAIAVVRLSLIVVIVFWGWQFTKTLLPYASVIVPTFIAAGQVLFKDWNSYRPKWIRWVLIAAIAMVGTWAVYYQHQQFTDREAKDFQARTDKAASEARVRSAEKAQADNTVLYLSSFETLSNKITDLQTTVATKELQDQLTKTQTELEKTRNALSLPPPIKILSSLKSFNIYATNPDRNPVDSITLPLEDEGVVKVPLYIFNPESRPALKGEITVEICTSCKYAKEPTGFVKISGDMETRRQLMFDHINSVTQFNDIVLHITPPHGASQISVGILVKCTTCQHSEGLTIFTVKLSGKHQ